MTQNDVSGIREFIRSGKESVQDTLKAIFKIDNEQVLNSIVENIEVTDGAIKEQGNTINTTVLFSAIRWKSWRCVLTLMRRGVSTDCVRGPLMQAALENNNCEMIQNLLPQTTLEEAEIYALEAAKRGSADVLDMILQHMPEAKSAKRADTGDGLLHVSARSGEAGSVDCLEILLDKYSLNTEDLNDEDRTPLYVAAAGEIQLLTKQSNGLWFQLHYIGFYAVRLNL